jgi:hypothetical protein
MASRILPPIFAKCPQNGATNSFFEYQKGGIMRSILGIVFFVAALATFPGDTSQTLQKGYGTPISETNRVRPGVVASARYGASGRACAIVVEPEQPHCPLNNPKNTIGDYRQAVAILKELVPETERGQYVIGGFVNIFCLSADTDCFGVNEDWQKLTIFRSGSNDRQHYATIQWKRDECQGIGPDMR